MHVLTDHHTAAVSGATLDLESAMAGGATTGAVIGGVLGGLLGGPLGIPFGILAGAGIGLPTGSMAACVTNAIEDALH